MCKCLSWPFSKPPEPEPEIIIPQEKTEKYALLIAISEYPPECNCNLQGCAYDLVDNMRIRLINQFNFHPDNIRLLLNERATFDNIIDRTKWLISHENAELVKLYSGHGAYVPDRNGDEVDGVDEVMVCYDHDWDRPLIDDILGGLYSQTPASSFLSFITDSCHSETQDRDFRKKPKFNNKFLRPPADIYARNYLLKKNIKHIGKSAPDNFMIFSGCRDDQTSADAYINNQWQGAFTWAYSQLIKPDLTWADIYQSVISLLSSQGFDQVPQLNGAQIDTRPIFGGV